MTTYLWVYLLGGVGALSLVLFLSTLSKDALLVKRLRKSRRSLSINFSLVVVSLTSVGLIIYLFVLLKDQIRLLG